MTWAIPRAHLTAATEAWDRWCRSMARAARQHAARSPVRPTIQVEPAGAAAARDAAILACALIVILLAVLGMVVQWSVDGLRTPATPTVATLGE
jgi:hypothetical protein